MSEPFNERARALKDRLGLTDQGCADYLGVPLPTWRKWLDGDRTPGAAVERLVEILGLIEALVPSLHSALLGSRSADHP